MKVAAALTGTVMGLIGVVVILGMANGLLNREWERGTASTEAVLIQEGCGVFALAALVLVFRQLHLLWLGERAFLGTAAAVVLALVLSVVWGFAYLLEFSA